MVVTLGRPNIVYLLEVLRVEPGGRQVEDHANNRHNRNQTEERRRNYEAWLGAVQRQRQREDETHGKEHDVHVDEGVEQSATLPQLLELLICSENWRKDLVEEGVDGGEHGANDEELEEEAEESSDWLIPTELDVVHPGAQIGMLLLLPCLS